jgi:hypothetical protein
MATPRRACPPAPAPLEAYCEQFDPLLATLRTAEQFSTLPGRPAPAEGSQQDVDGSGRCGADRASSGSGGAAAAVLPLGITEGGRGRQPSAPHAAALRARDAAANGRGSRSRAGLEERGETGQVEAPGAALSGWAGGGLVGGRVGPCPVLAGACASSDWSGTDPVPNWPCALRQVRSWLVPWWVLPRWWRAWSHAPPPKPLRQLLEWVGSGHPLNLYALE